MLKYIITATMRTGAPKTVSITIATIGNTICGMSSSPWPMSLSWPSIVKLKCRLVLCLIDFSRSVSAVALGETLGIGETDAAGLIADWGATLGDCPMTFQAKTVKQTQMRKRV